MPSQHQRMSSQAEAMQLLEQPLLRMLAAKQPITVQVMKEQTQQFWGLCMDVDSRGQLFTETFGKMAIFQILLQVFVEPSTVQDVKQVMVAFLYKIASLVRLPLNRAFVFADDSVVQMMCWAIQHDQGAARRSAAELLELFAQQLNAETLPNVPPEALMYVTDLVFQTDQRVSQLATQYFAQFLGCVFTTNDDKKLEVIQMRAFSISSCACLQLINTGIQLNEIVRQRAVTPTNQIIERAQQLENEAITRAKIISDLAVTGGEHSLVDLVINRIQQLIIYPVIFTSLTYHQHTQPLYSSKMEKDFTKQAVDLNPVDFQMKHVRALIPESESTACAPDVVLEPQVALYLLNCVLQQLGHNSVLTELKECDQYWLQTDRSIGFEQANYYKKMISSDFWSEACIKLSTNAATISEFAKIPVSYSDECIEHIISLIAKFQLNGLIVGQILKMAGVKHYLMVEQQLKEIQRIEHLRKEELERAHRLVLAGVPKHSRKAVDERLRALVKQKQRPFCDYLIQHDTGGACLEIEQWIQQVGCVEQVQNVQQ